MSIRKISLAGIALCAAATAFVLLPQSALAATLNITQSASEGASNPPSTITITDTGTGQVVNTVDYAGGEATIPPVDIATGAHYVVSAEATSGTYYIQSKEGTVDDENAEYPVNLLAVPAKNITVAVAIAPYVENETINVSLYSRTDLTNAITTLACDQEGAGAAVSTLDYDAARTYRHVVFPKIVRGDYIVKIDIRGSDMYSYPAETSLTVSDEGLGLDGAMQSLIIGYEEIAPAPVVQQPQEQVQPPVEPAVVQKTNVPVISQTGDVQARSLVVLMIGVLLSFVAYAIMRRHVR